MKLKINHITQANNVDEYGRQITNDCGPAIVAMCASGTLDDAIAACHVHANEPAHFGDIMRGLLWYGIKSKYERLTPPQIREQLKDGRPVICLIDYGRVPDNLRRSKHKGAHFVLAVGSDADHILIHDPLGDAENGAYIPYPDVLLGAVMRHVPGNVYNDQCLVILREYGTDTAVSTEIEEPSPELQLKVIFKRLGVDNLGDALVRIGQLERGGKRPL